MFHSKTLKYIKNHFSTNSKILSSKQIRNQFLDYFIHEKDHKFIKSSPVIPFGDPGLAFVNAGMNQFKNIFLGISPITFKSATNSQKCIRIGGKHNDLDIVGTDSYHHTFFEMLGNWSFNDYFKLEACQMSYELLTKVYGLNKNQLYFTFFGGDNNLGLLPDNETKEIWQSLGISEDRILPFGMKDNFWEMGRSGPCGPCTEIHFDHIPGRTNSQLRVNQGFEDVTEIWNLVFIQYHRNENGDLQKLKNNFVDTGMGFERLVAILQKKNSNYDTDLFIPLFKTIEKMSGVKPYEDRYGEDSSLFRGYRVLADHIRMLTICLADGMLPDDYNHKLRHVLRKTIILREEMFPKCDGLLSELTNQVADSLGEIYPEIWKNLDKVKLLIEHEERYYKELRSSIKKAWDKLTTYNPEIKNLDIDLTSGLVPAYKEIIKYRENLKENVLSGEFLYRLNTSYGLDQKNLQTLADANKIKPDWENFNKILISNKLNDKGSYCIKKFSTIVDQLKSNSIPETDNSLKYTYFSTSDKYIFPSLRCRVLAIIENGQLVSSPTSTKFSIILDSSNLYYNSGNQISDYGVLIKESNKCFIINDIENIDNFLFHHGELIEGEIKVGDILELKIDEQRRLSNMRNHTATHVLNEILHSYFKLTYQISSSITDEYFKFKFTIYGQKFDFEDLIAIDKEFNKYIKMKYPVSRKVVTHDEFLKCENLIHLPGEVYPSNEISLIEIKQENKTSCEPCCGTHLFSTGHIEDFAIIDFNSEGNTKKQILAITGPKATQSKRLVSSYEAQIEKLKALINKLDLLEAESLYKKIINETVDEKHLPYINKSLLLKELNLLKLQISISARKKSRSDLITEINNCKDKSKAIVYYFPCYTSDTIDLYKLGNLVKDKPFMLMNKTIEIIRCRCTVPENFVNDNFNALKWMDSITSIFKKNYIHKNQDLLTQTFSYRNIKNDDKIKKAVEIAKIFAEKNL